jgi:hypothetical protein
MLMCSGLEAHIDINGLLMRPTHANVQVRLISLYDSQQLRGGLPGPALQACTRTHYTALTQRHGVGPPGPACTCIPTALLPRHGGGPPGGACMHLYLSNSADTRSPERARLETARTCIHTGLTRWHRADRAAQQSCWILPTVGLRPRALTRHQPSNCPHICRLVSFLLLVWIFMSAPTFDLLFTDGLTRFGRCNVGRGPSVTWRLSSQHNFVRIALCNNMTSEGQQR